MAGMYEIVGFDEIVGSYPPHSTQGAFGHHHRRRRRHHGWRVPCRR